MVHCAVLVPGKGKWCHGPYHVMDSYIVRGILLCYKHQFSSVAQSCPTLCDPMDCSTPGFPVHHQLTELVQIHVRQGGDAIQPSHPLLSPSPPAFNLSQHQDLFQGVSSSHQVASVLEHYVTKYYVTSISAPISSVQFSHSVISDSL